MTIHCGEENEELFDVSAKKDGEPYWIGWCNEAYNQEWKGNDWKLEKGEYLVEVKIWSGDVHVRDFFRFNTDTGKIIAQPCCCDTCRIRSVE